MSSLSFLRKLRPSRRLAPMLAGPLTALASATALVACSLVVGTDDLTGGLTCDGGSCVHPASDAMSTTPGTDATNPCGADLLTDLANCGACGHACASGETRCAAGVCSTGCPGGIVYVSPTGVDTADGCTSAHALATVTQAIGLVSQQQATGEEIHVCKGTFTEPNLVLDYPVSLLGGYDCGTWMRTSTYGYPKFDRINETILATTANNDTGNTLGIASSLVTNAVIVDGFTIAGPSMGGFSNLGAVLVSGSAAPTLSNDDIEAASSGAGTTIGIHCSIEGAPLVVNDLVNGGGGAVTSEAMDLTASSALYVHDSVLMAGTSPGLSYAVHTTADSPFGGQREYVTNSTINGGTGTTTIALDITDSAVDVIGNTITGGTAVCPDTVNCAALGLRLGVDNGGTYAATIAQNRITGGSISGGMALALVGIFVEGMSRVLIADNAVQAGAGAEASGQAVYVQGVGQAVIEQNTLYGYQTALVVRAVTSADVDGNLFIGNIGDQASGMISDSCIGPTTISSFSSNAFVDTNDLVLENDLSGADCPMTGFDTIADVEAHFQDVVRGATLNRRVASSCTATTKRPDGGVDSDDAMHCATEPACTTATAPSPGPSACIDTVLSSWDDPSQGAGTLLNQAETWKLSPSVPCIVAQGVPGPLPDPLTDDAGVDYGAVDVNGSMRTPPFSIGAYEDDGACDQ